MFEFWLLQNIILKTSVKHGFNTPKRWTMKIIIRYDPQCVIVLCSGQLRLIHHWRQWKSPEVVLFRCFAMHLEALQKQDRLFVNNLIFDKVILNNVKEPWNNDPSKLAIAVNDGFRWQRNNDGTYTVMKRTIGRVLISNYDPHARTDGRRASRPERDCQSSARQLCYGGYTPRSSLRRSSAVRRD